MGIAAISSPDGSSRRITRRRGPCRIPPSGGLPPTQDPGAAVFAAGGFQAIRYPSARRPGGACLVVFTARLRDPAFVEVHDPWGNIDQRLP
ncbi:MAG TPA: RES domain-containing protein [Armatimonadota bacterium]|nr:RES domain-containing protein [Armatimonadota bacterium]